MGKCSHWNRADLTTCNRGCCHLGLNRSPPRQKERNNNHNECVSILRPGFRRRQVDGLSKTSWGHVSCQNCFLDGQWAGGGANGDESFGVHRIAVVRRRRVRPSKAPLMAASIRLHHTQHAAGNRGRAGTSCHIWRSCFVAHAQLHGVHTNGGTDPVQAALEATALLAMLCSKCLDMFTHIQESKAGPCVDADRGVWYNDSPQAGQCVRQLRAVDVGAGEGRRAVGAVPCTLENC